MALQLTTSTLFFFLSYQSKVQQSVSPILLLFLFQNILTEGGWMASIDEKRTTSNCRGNCTLLPFMCFPQLLLLNFSLSLSFETKIKTRRGNVWRRNDTQSPPASFLACFREKKPRKNLRFIVVQYTHFLIFYIFEMLYARTTPNTDERQIYWVTLIASSLPSSQYRQACIQFSDGYIINNFNVYMIVKSIETNEFQPFDIV